MKVQSINRVSLRHSAAQALIQTAYLSAALIGCLALGACNPNSGNSQNSGPTNVASAPAAPVSQSSYQPTVSSCLQNGTSGINSISGFSPFTPYTTGQTYIGYSGFPAPTSGGLNGFCGCPLGATPVCGSGIGMVCVPQTFLPTSPFLSWQFQAGTNGFVQNGFGTLGGSAFGGSTFGSGSGSTCTNNIGQLCVVNQPSSCGSIPGVACVPLNGIPNQTITPATIPSGICVSIPGYSGGYPGSVNGGYPGTLNGSYTGTINGGYPNTPVFYGSRGY